MTGLFSIIRRSTFDRGGKTMKNKSNSKSALDAMRRAAIKAIEKAANLDLEIPEWQNGKIVYVNAKKKLKRLRCS